MSQHAGTILVVDTGDTFRAEWRGHAAESDGNPGKAALDVAAMALGDAPHTIRKCGADLATGEHLYAVTIPDAPACGHTPGTARQSDED